MVVPYQSFPNSGEDVSASVSADHQRWNGERPPGEEIYLLLVICSPPLKIWKWLSAAGQIRCTMMTMLRNATTSFFPPTLFSLKYTIEAVTLNDEWPKQEPKFGQIHSFIFRVEVVKMAYWTRCLLYYFALSNKFAGKKMITLLSDLLVFMNMLLIEKCSWACNS